MAQNVQNYYSVTYKYLAKSSHKIILCIFSICVCQSRETGIEGLENLSPQTPPTPKSDSGYIQIKEKRVAEQWPKGTLALSLEFEGFI